LPHRVLVVDDEPRVRGMLCDALALWGYRPDGAGSVSEGLRLFERGGYDLVMTDFTMPGANGLQLIQSVRDRDPSVGVIMVTASPGELERQRQQLGFRLVRKPVHLSGLETAVREALASRTP